MDIPQNDDLDLIEPDDDLDMKAPAVSRQSKRDDRIPTSEPDRSDYREYTIWLANRILTNALQENTESIAVQGCQLVNHVGQHYGISVKAEYV